MEMRVDEAGHDDATGNVDLLATLVVAAGADDTLARDGNVRGDEVARHEVEELSALQDDIGRLPAGSLIDEAFQVGHGEVSRFHCEQTLAGWRQEKRAAASNCACWLRLGR